MQLLVRWESFRSGSARLGRSQKDGLPPAGGASGQAIPVQGHQLAQKGRGSAVAAPFKSSAYLLWRTSPVGLGTARLTVAHSAASATAANQRSTPRPSAGSLGFTGSEIFLTSCSNSVALRSGGMAKRRTDWIRGSAM